MTSVGNQYSIRFIHNLPYMSIIAYSMVLTKQYNHNNSYLNPSLYNGSVQRNSSNWRHRHIFIISLHPVDPILTPLMSCQTDLSPCGHHDSFFLERRILSVLEWSPGVFPSRYYLRFVKRRVHRAPGAVSNIHGRRLLLCYITY